jgi:hypothetical protein
MSSVLIYSQDFEPIEEHQHSKNNYPNAQYLDDYEAYVRRELPRCFRSDLETAVNDEVGPIEERLMNRIMDMYQSCQERVLNTYQSNQAASSHPEANHAAASSSGAKVSQTEERTFQEEQYLDDFGVETTLFADIEDLPSSRAPFQSSTDFISSSASRTPEVLNRVIVCDHSALTEYLDPVYHQENSSCLLPLYPSRSFPDELTIDSNGEGSKISQLRIYYSRAQVRQTRQRVLGFRSLMETPRLRLRICCLVLLSYLMD